jgi:hypothetical protein
MAKANKVNKWMVDPEDAVILLIDHQSGLFQLVKDIELPTLRAHVTALGGQVGSGLTFGRLPLSFPHGP